MLKTPSILILDEPTAQLDATSAAHLNETLKQIELGKTTFRVAHRLSEFRHGDASWCSKTAVSPPWAPTRR